MKKRQRQILKSILDEETCLIEEILDTFHISKRTLYYDIEDINYYLRGHGQLKNIDHRLCYVGNKEDIQDLCVSHTSPMDVEERCDHFLYLILNGNMPSLQDLEKRLGLSKNTVVETMHRIRKRLAMQGLKLEYDHHYVIYGAEEKIRDIFIELMYDDNNVMSWMSEDVLLFNEQNHLELSDFSLGLLSKYVTFTKKRIKEKKFVHVDYSEETKTFAFYGNTAKLLGDTNIKEVSYLVAFISSLTSLKSDEKATIVDQGVDRLIHRFEVMAAVELTRKEELRKSVRRHLLSSYYRIKFKFPIKNFSLFEIKKNYASLFTIVKSILEDEKILPEFKGIREEEIAFLTAYFGGYLRTMNYQNQVKNKVLIVCPHGLMVSKTLEIQLYQNIPTIQVMDCISYQQLSSYEGEYDYIISTIDIEGYENVIKVNPVLSRYDITQLMERCFVQMPFEEKRNTSEILKVIKDNCVIEDEEKLIRELEKLLNRKEEVYQPMLKELINENRIQIVSSVANWEAAIQLASEPILEDGSITQDYVEQMIQSIKEHGPYIVLADYFALPHASNMGGVHCLAMSFLVVEEAVDLLGKPVHVFAVLAPIDNTSHLKALASLAQLLYDPENLAILCKGDKQAIIQLLSK